MNKDDRDALCKAIEKGELNGDKSLADIFSGKSPNEIIDALSFSNELIRAFLSEAIDTYNDKCAALANAESKHGTKVFVNGKKVPEVFNAHLELNDAREFVENLLTKPLAEVYTSITHGDGKPLLDHAAAERIESEIDAIGCDVHDAAANSQIAARAGVAVLASINGKALDQFSAHDWGTINADLTAMIKDVLCVLNNTQRMRMVYDETRTGITQFAARGITKLPSGITGKKAVEFLAMLLTQAIAPGIDTDKITSFITSFTFPELYEFCIAAMKDGLAFQKALQERTTQVAETQSNKVYAAMGIRRTGEITDETTAAIGRCETMLEFLVGKKKERIAKGKAAQKECAKQYAAEKARAKADKERAIDRVENDPGVKAEIHGAIRAACRRVCKEFTPMGTRKNEFGRCADGYAPLTDYLGNPIKPETLEHNFRERRKENQGDGK